MIKLRQNRGEPQWHGCAKRLPCKVRSLNRSEADSRGLRVGFASRCYVINEQVVNESIDYRRTLSAMVVWTGKNLERERPVFDISLLC